MRTGVVATLALALFLGVARGGDPIQFSNDKAKPAPANNRPVEADLFKSWSKPASPSAAPGLNSLTPLVITPSRTLDPKEERRLRNAREERKNWMLLEPGELQKRDDEEEAKFGGRAFSLDSGNDDSGNYLFQGSAERNSKADKAKSTPERQAPAESNDEPKKDNRTSMKIFAPREGEQQGAHTASELNLKGLIDTTHVNPADFNKNEPSLFQFFKDNALPPPDRDAEARRESFRDFINGPRPNGAPSGISDPINFRTDLTQERMNPIMPNRPAFELPALARAPDAFSAKPPAGGFNPMRPPGLPEMVTGGPRQPLTGIPAAPSLLYLTPNEPPKTPRASIMDNSFFNREQPRRGGL